MYTVFKFFPNHSARRMALFSVSASHPCKLSLAIPLWPLRLRFPAYRITRSKNGRREAKPEECPQLLAMCRNARSRSGRSLRNRRRSLRSLSKGCVEVAGVDRDASAMWPMTIHRCYASWRCQCWCHYLLLFSQCSATGCFPPSDCFCFM